MAQTRVNLKRQPDDQGVQGAGHVHAAGTRHDSAPIQGVPGMAPTRVNPNCKLEDQGIRGLGEVHYNLLEPALIEAAIRRGEGKLGLGGAFLV